MACAETTLSLDCNTGTSIHILSAAYGTLNESPTANASCQSEDTLSMAPCYDVDGYKVVQGKCEGRPTCTILVQQSVFSTTTNYCPSTANYLKVTYGCVTRK